MVAAALDVDGAADDGVVVVEPEAVDVVGSAAGVEALAEALLGRAADGSPLAAVSAGWVLKLSRATRPAMVPAIGENDATHEMS